MILFGRKISVSVVEPWRLLYCTSVVCAAVWYFGLLVLVVVLALELGRVRPS